MKKKPKAIKCCGYEVICGYKQTPRFPCRCKCHLSNPSTMPNPETMIHPRNFGDTTKALVEFYVAGKQGKSIIYKTPEGDFYSPKAFEQTLAIKEQEMKVEFVEELAEISARIESKYDYTMPMINLCINDLIQKYELQ